MDFIKVVTQPLGLTGFALSLVFGVLSRKRGMPRWWPGAAIGMAVAALLGGLFLAYSQSQPQPAPKPVPPVSNGNRAETKGNCSPALAGVNVGGNLNLDCAKTDKGAK